MSETRSTMQVEHFAHVSCRCVLVGATFDTFVLDRQHHLDAPIEAPKEDQYQGGTGSSNHLTLPLATFLPLVPVWGDVAAGCFGPGVHARREDEARRAKTRSSIQIETYFVGYGYLRHITSRPAASFQRPHRITQKINFKAEPATPNHYTFSLTTFLPSVAVGADVAAGFFVPGVFNQGHDRFQGTTQRQAYGAHGRRR